MDKKHLIGLMISAGVMVAGAPFGSVGFAASIVQLCDEQHKEEELKGVETSAKLIQVLNDKYAERLEHLDDNSVDYGDYRFEIASDEMEDKRQGYAKRYDYVVNKFGEYDAVKLVDKQQFVDYMMKNGDKIDAYINSEEFNGIITQIKGILDDPATTKEQKLNKAQNVVFAEAKFLDDPKLDVYKTCSIIFAIVSGLSGITGILASGLGSTDYDKKIWNVLSVLVAVLFGFISKCAYLVLTDDLAIYRDNSPEGCY